MRKNNLNELRSSDIFSHIPQVTYLPRWGVLLMDVMLCTIAFWISVWVGSGFLNYVNLNNQIVPIGVQYLIVMLVQIIAFWVFHTYSGILRYSTFIDTVKVLLSNICTGLAGRSLGFLNRASRASVLHVTPYRSYPSNVTA